MSYISNLGGITLDSAFKLDSAQPLDLRFVVPSGKNKDDLLTSSCYPGMEIWDTNSSKKYRAIPSGSTFKWEEVASGGNLSAGTGIAISSNKIYNTGLINVKSSSNGYLTQTMGNTNGTEDSDILVYELPVATPNSLGGVSIGFTEDGQNYAVKLNSSDQMYVYVPWTDTKVTSTLNTSTKYYLTGTTKYDTNTGEQIFDRNVYVNTTAGALHASSFNLDTNATIQYDSTNKCIKFVFA